MPIRDKTIRNHSEEYVILMESHETLGDAMARLRESNYPRNDTFLAVLEPDGQYRVILFSELLDILGETWSDEQDRPLSHLVIPPADRVVPKDTPEGGKSILDWVDTHPGSTLVVIDDQGFVCLFANPNRSIVVGVEVKTVGGEATVVQPDMDTDDGVAKGIRIDTGGGAYIWGDVVAGRHFIGRDQVILGDYVGGDNIKVGDISGATGIAIGREAHAEVHTGPEAIPSRPQYGEQRRRLDAAMPRESYVGQTTEVRILIALPDSGGLRAHLPDYTEMGDLIEKGDVRGGDVSLSFDKNVPVNVYVRVEAAKRDFEVERPERTIKVYPDRDSGATTVFLTPLRPLKRGRVAVHAYEDPERQTSLGSVNIMTEVRALEGEMAELPQSDRLIPSSREDDAFEPASSLVGAVHGAPLIATPSNRVGITWALASAQNLSVRNLTIVQHIGDRIGGDSIKTRDISGTGVALGRRAHGEGRIQRGIEEA